MINQQTQKINYGILLEEIAKADNAYGNVAKILKKKIYAAKKITKAIDLALEANVSNALITKFVKELGFGNFNELAYVHNQSLVVHEQAAIKHNDKDILKATEIIDNARKIIFVGASNSYFINQDFATKLQRMDKWVLLTPSKYEQVGFSNLADTPDVIIINSISFQHKYMSEVAEKTKAKIIVFTSVPKEKLSFKPDVYFKINTPERNDLFRIVTMSNRNATLLILDEITNALLSSDKNYHLMEKSSYRNKK